ncbi:hypothetical protein RIF29_27043 [Crotalaria pallida]|uniref:Uncharacterized protein n=1 Tax=Crotalaria pallida TaxID=3830 RepID=A0AAN9ENC7_CROPI
MHLIQEINAGNKHANFMRDPLNHMATLADFMSDPLNHMATLCSGRCAVKELVASHSKMEKIRKGLYSNWKFYGNVAKNSWSRASMTEAKGKCSYIQV